MKASRLERAARSLGWQVRVQGKLGHNGNQTYLAEWKGQLCVLKYDTSASDDAQAKREARALRRLQDVPGIPNIHKKATRQGGKTLILKEYIPGPHIKAYQRESGGDPRLEQMIKELLHTIHAQDLTPNDPFHQNIIIHQGRPHIIDFGHSVFSKEPGYQERCQADLFNYALACRAF